MINHPLSQPNKGEKPWQCPGCDMYYAPSVKSCDCEFKWEQIYPEDGTCLGWDESIRSSCGNSNCICNAENP